MTYTSTVTSKGTITLPASIRAKLGITEGKKVTIQLRGDTIEVVPQGGWEEFFAVGEKLRADLKKRGVSVTDIQELRAQADRVKTKEYRDKYGYGR